jgi:hypothetical protein
MGLAGSLYLAIRAPFRPRFAVPLFLTVVTAGTSHAQVQVELGPILGYYRPVGSFQSTSATAVTLPARPRDKAGAALGVAGRVWLGHRFGLEVQVASARSSVPASVPPGGPVGPTPVRVLILSAQGTWTLASGPETRFWVGAGAGAVRHGGAAYAPYGSPTDVAGTFGVGTSVRVHGSVRLVVGVATFLYSLDVQSNAGPTLQHGFQVDPLAHLSLAWSWP